MKNINENQNLFNSDGKLLKLNLDENSNDYLYKFKSESPSKKLTYKNMVTSNFSIKESNKLPNNSNKNLANRNYKSGTVYFSQNNITKLINNAIKQQEIRKNESINEAENKESKLVKAYTKGADKNIKLNNNLLEDINSRNLDDRKRTFQLIYKSPKKKQKSPNNVFKTNINNNISDKNLKIFLYEDEDEIFSRRNDLIIPEEDKIFDEFQKYERYTEKFNKRYRIKTTINNDEEDNKKVKITKSVKIQKSQLSSKNKENKKPEKFTKTFFDSKGKFVPSQLDKDIFDCLYKTNDNFYTQLNLLKKSKNRKKLKDYQTGLLEYIKDITSVYGYDILKKKLEELERYNRYKRRTNFKFLKKLEIDEKGIIEDVNKTNKQYLRSKTSKGNKKYKFKLPVLEFKSVIEELEDKKLKDFLKRRNISQRDSKLFISQSLKNSKINKKNDINKIKFSLFKK